MAGFSRISVQKRKIDRSVASRNCWFGTMAKAPPCPERRMRTPLREEESEWSVPERTAIASQEGKSLEGKSRD